MPKSVALLAIGTEITTGQIVDTNSAWLANELVNLHFKVACHFSVPDELPLMHAALAFCHAKADITLVTGGLGPTSDDITRNAVAAFCEKELAYDAVSWEHIEQRFALIGGVPTPSNKQQCFFPEGATILVNKIGTAHAFATEHRTHKIICLPGPPKEVQNLFRDHLKVMLQGIIGETDPLILRRWHTLGHSEAALGEVVERALKGSHLITGYRPHLPYVEVKIWGLASEEKAHQAYLERLDEALKPWTITRDDEDAAASLVQRLGHFGTITIRDAASGGALTDRLQKAFNKVKAPTPDLRIETLRQAQPDDQGSVAPFLSGATVKEFRGYLGPYRSDHSWEVHWSFGGKTQVHRLKIPFPSTANKERQGAYISELSLIDWLRCLEA